MKAPVFDIYKGTTHDGPGLRDTVFFKGCPLSCKWCHNPEGIGIKNRMWYEKRSCIGCGICKESCPSDAISFGENGVNISTAHCKMCGVCSENCPTGAIVPISKDYSVSDLCNEILKDKEYFKSSGGGVTVSGGEAMMHGDFLCEFFSEIKKNDVHTALDTTGFCDTKKLSDVLKYTDTVLYDIKVINPYLHKKWTGVDNHLILENIVMISRMKSSGINTELWIRTPIIPDFTDDETVISEIAGFIKSNLSGTVNRWELCAFNNSCNHKYEKLGMDWELKDKPLISKEKMLRLTEIAKTSDVPQVLSTGIMSE